MSLTTTPRRMKRRLPNHPAPLDMSLLGVPGASYPRKTIIVSAARPSIKETVAALGVNYSLSSGGIPESLVIPSLPPLPRPLPKIPTLALPRSSPNLVSEISSDSSHYTTTGIGTASLEAAPLTTPPNLTRLYTLSLPSSPVHRESVDVAIQPASPPDSTSPIMQPLLTPAPMRPVRRWGMTVFPQNKVIRCVSSAPSSPISFVSSPASIVAVKSPVEWRDSKGLSDGFSLVSPFVASLPQETNVPSVPPIPSIKPPLSPTPSPPLFLPTTEDSASDVDAELSRMALGGKEKQPRSPRIRLNPKSALRGSNSHHKRISLTHRRESSVRRPNRRLMLKRDSGVPFAHHVAMATEPSEVEGNEMREGRRDAKRWSGSRRFLQMSSKRAKETVVMMRKGNKAEEKDIVAVIPQLRELKAPKRLRL